MSGFFRQLCVGAWLCGALLPEQWALAGLGAAAASASTLASTPASAPTSAPTTVLALPGVARSGVATSGILSSTPDFPFAEPHFETVGDTESIPDGSVTTLAQDNNGLLWIGTQSGLIRFDGYHLHKFVHDPLQINSLPGDYVKAMHVAADGRLWIGTSSDGLARYDPAREQFINYRHDPARADSLGGGSVWAIAGDGAGGLWVGTDQGLHYLSPNAQGFVHFHHEEGNPASLFDDRVRSLLLDGAGRLWVGSVAGLQRLRSDGQGFEAQASDPEQPDSLFGKRIATLFEAQDGKLWVGTGKHGAGWLMPGASKINWQAGAGAPAAGSPAPAIIQDAGMVRTISQPHPDQIWLGTENGGVEVLAAHDGHLLQQFRHDPAIPGSLSLNHVSSLLLDRAGLLWVGSWGGGLQRHNARNLAFRMLRHSPTRPDGLSHGNIASVLELKNGQILLGTNGNGIDILDRQKGLVGGYRHRASAQPRAGEIANLPGSRVKALAQTPDGSLWAGVALVGVVRLLPGAQQWQLCTGLVGDQVFRMVTDASGGLWVGSNTGLAYWSETTQRFESLPMANGKPMLSSVYAIDIDASGRVWAASDNGLWLREPGAKHLIGIHHEPGRADALISDDVGGVLVDRNNRLWIATAQGLERLREWDGQRARFDHVSRGLLAVGQNPGANLQQDAQGRIWNADFMLEPDKPQLHLLSRADGFDIGGSWVGSYSKTHDGLLLFGGPRGLLIIDPARFSPWQYQPNIVATELSINGKQEPLGRLLPILQLAPGQRTFAISFGALDYSAPNRVRYRYRLQGYERDWITADHEHRSASYGNLWPGSYTLQVRGTNRAGEWSRRVLTVPILVLPAFWQTGAFLLCVSVALLLALAGGYRWRVTRLHRRAQKLHRLVDARTADILNLAAIGRELTATLDTEQAFERVYTQVCARLDAHVFSISIVNPLRQMLVSVYEINNGVRRAAHEFALDTTHHPASWCVRERREMIVLQREQLADYFGSASPSGIDGSMQTLAFIPLAVGPDVIGCLSVQSLVPQAYAAEQIEFLHVLASYTAIAASNAAAHGELAESHQQLADSHQQLASAHQHLQDTQLQLIQAEKMASLGQLVANVAHEINTPISAVKASGSNILDALRQTLADLPALFMLLEPGEQALFHRLIEHADRHYAMLSSRAERTLQRELSAQLREAGLARAHEKATILVQLHISTELAEYWPLIKHQQADLILHTAHAISRIINNTHNIHMALARVSRVVFALKAFSHNGQTGDLVDTDLRSGLETVLLIYQSKFGPALQLVQEYDEIGPVPCLPEELNQVWLNLIHNALQAMNYQGKLSISITRAGDMAEVRIGDTGCGIPEGLLGRIFEPFFTTRPTGEGSGLGLAIVRQIILRHRGTIEVHSSVGQGSTVLVRLPCHREKT
jgi:signal transduction histidine kinase/sugar lactone lactonase YvrE